MSIKSDKWIRRMAQQHGMIEPFEPGQVREVNGQKIVSYGTSSYGYDIRCAPEFKVFTNIYSTVVDPKKSLWEVVSDGNDFIKVGQVEMPSRAYVSCFGFKGPDQQKAAGVLSGGERNRLNLALTLKQGGNLLLLDEPTNDLDVETLGSLENALLEFPGCAVVISHDRWFLDRVATHILAYEGDAKWFWFEGNFESYEENKISRLGIDAARPHRATYRKLTR
jgi:ATPase subunit of ABC transporter with duplicated ATPase domains